MYCTVWIYCTVGFLHADFQRLDSRRWSIIERHRCNKAILQCHRLGGLALDDTEVDLLVVNAPSVLLTANLDLIENILSDGAARRETEISSCTIKNSAITFHRLEEVYFLVTLQTRSQAELAALKILAGDDCPIVRARVGEGIGPGHIKQFSRAVCGTSDGAAINSLNLMRLMDKALGVDFNTASGRPGRSFRGCRFNWSCRFRGLGGLRWSSWFRGLGGLRWSSWFRINNHDRVNASDFCDHISIVFNSRSYGSLGRNYRSQCRRCGWRRGRGDRCGGGWGSCRLESRRSRNACELLSLRIVRAHKAGAAKVRPVRVFSTACDGTFIISSADIHTSTEEGCCRRGISGLLCRERSRRDGSSTRRGRWRDRRRRRRCRRGGHFLHNIGNDILNGGLNAVNSIFLADQSLAANLGLISIVGTACLGFFLRNSHEQTSEMGRSERYARSQYQRCISSKINYAYHHSGALHSRR